jgi:hypothetical protein
MVICIGTDPASPISINFIKVKNTKSIPTKLIAPCGMNCRLCWGYIRDKNTCPGCRCLEAHESQKSQHRTTCILKNCEHNVGGITKYCSEGCGSFPCARLKGLDKRYREKYGMSMIDNLSVINASGIRHFIRSEKEKWACPKCGELICVHKPACLSCGYKWN